MKDFISLAENADELAQIKYFLSQIHGFTIDYLFALRKVLPTLKCEFKNLSNDERAELISYISKLDIRMTSLFFNSLKFIEPIASHLIGEELDMYDTMMKELSSAAEGDEWKNNSVEKLNNPLKANSNGDLGETDRKELEQLMQSLSSKKKRPPTASEDNPKQSEEKEDVKKKKTRQKKSASKMNDKDREGFLKQLGDAFMEGFNAVNNPTKKPKKPRKSDSDDNKKQG